MPWHDGAVGWSALLGMRNLLSQGRGHLECRRCHWFICFGPVCAHSVVSDSVTARTVAHQAPLSVGFSRQDVGADCYFLLQGIFPTQGLNPNLL